MTGQGGGDVPESRRVGGGGDSPGASARALRRAHGAARLTRRKGAGEAKGVVRGVVSGCADGDGGEPEAVSEERHGGAQKSMGDDGGSAGARGWRGVTRLGRKKQEGEGVGPRREMAERRSGPGEAGPKSQEGEGGKWAGA